MSKVLEFPALPPSAAAAHFRDALARATDPSDVHADLESGEADFVVLDARSPETFARGHVPGAINIPHRRIDAVSTAALAKNRPIVTYCDGIGCNASTKAALKLAELGFTVKEMLNGLDGWRRDGFAVETGETPGRRGHAGETTAATSESGALATGDAAGIAAGQAAGKVPCGC